MYTYKLLGDRMHLDLCAPSILLPSSRIWWILQFLSSPSNAKPSKNTVHTNCQRHQRFLNQQKVPTTLLHWHLTLTCMILLHQLHKPSVPSLPSPATKMLKMLALSQSKVSFFYKVCDSETETFFKLVLLSFTACKRHAMGLSLQDKRKHTGLVNESDLEDTDEHRLRKKSMNCLIPLTCTDQHYFFSR